MLYLWYSEVMIVQSMWQNSSNRAILQNKDSDPRKCGSRGISNSFFIEKFEFEGGPSEADDNLGRCNEIFAAPQSSSSWWIQIPELMGGAWQTFGELRVTCGVTCQMVKQVWYRQAQPRLPLSGLNLRIFRPQGGSLAAGMFRCHQMSI